MILLAAGRGRRMRSGKVKLLHALAGSPMVCHVARAAAGLKPGLLAAVVGNQADAVRAALESDQALPGQPPVFVTQTEQLGTAHAVMQAEPLIARRKGTVLILNGDVPLVTTATLRALLRRHKRARASATVLTAHVADPAGYGRIVRDGNGSFASIVEDRDAGPAQKAIREINSGLYCAEIPALFAALRRTGRSNAQGEYYLPDIFPILRGMGRRVEAYVYDPAEEVLGVNDRVELARAGKVLHRRHAEHLMESGVTLVDPDCTYIDPTVRVGRDTVIYPLARLEGATTIGEGCTIGTLAHISDTTIGDDVLVRDMCVVSGSTIAEGVRLGPFAHLRPGTVLEQDSHIGNFVEVKKSRIGRGSKANHLAYLGDAEIGEGCNIGAGTITCNYDGVRKNRTVLEDGVFIGSDTQLVAPVRVRRGAYIGAGSTITRDVPEYSLALTRAELRILKDWVKRRQQATGAEPKDPKAAAAGAGRRGKR